MAKKGYGYEYLCKRRIQKKGDLILRLSISGYADFIILSSSGNYLLECKTTKKKKWHPAKREIKQFLELKYIQEKHKISVFYQIRENGIERKLSLIEVKREYFS